MRKLKKEKSINMRKVLTYSSFVITSLLVVLAFVTATTYTQLGVAVVLYPFITFFAYKLFMVKSQKVPVVAAQLPLVNQIKEVEVETANIEKRANTIVADIDKRALLKIIGATGISFFLFSLLNRRPGAQFFGGTGQGISVLTDGSGKKVDPSERQPMDGYVISEIDEGFIAYYGFTNNSAAWYIMKEDPDEGSFRYIKGGSSFESNWVSRENLNYDYFHNIFSN